MPQGVVDLLEVVEVQDQNSRARRAARADVVERAAQAPLELGPVRQPSQGVVQRLVAQLADQLAVAQGDTGVVGHRLEEQDVVVLEGADVALPVGHHQDADDAHAATERNGHCLAHAVGGEPAPCRRIAGPARQQQRPGALHDVLEHPLVLGRGRFLRPLEPATGTESDPGEESPVGADEGRGGPVGPQQGAGLAEDAGHDLVDLGGVAHGLTEAVEPLQVDVPVEERGVAPVGEEQERAETDQQPGGE